MSLIQHQMPRAGQYIKFEVGSISRDKVEFSGGEFLPGEPYGIVGGKAVKLNFAADTGAEIAVGITYAYVDASEADAEGVATTRLTEVNAQELTWPEGATQGNIDGAVTALASKNIIVRGA